MPRPRSSPYVEAGDLVDGRGVMHNDFVIVGPAETRPAVARLTSVTDVMRAIAARGRFVSRGDDSGTHTQEMALWAAAGIDPRSLKRREETGQGMGATLNVADQKRAYTLTDRGTYLSLRKRLGLVILFQGDATPPQRVPRLRREPGQASASQGAPRRARSSTSSCPRPIQQAIAAFKRDEYGESLFFPDAIRRHPGR